VEGLQANCGAALTRDFPAEALCAGGGGFVGEEEVSANVLQPWIWALEEVARVLSDGFGWEELGAREGSRSL